MALSMWGEMSEQIEALYKVLKHLNAKIGALEAMVHLLAGMEAQRNPMIVALLKRTASGDVPDFVPDGPVAPPNATADERRLIEADLAEHRRATKQAIAELANQIAGFIDRANQKRS